MIRWSYVIPRLLVVLLVLGAARFGIPPLLRWGLTRALESATGADVCIAGVSASPARGAVRVQHLQIARQERETTNVLEFDSAELRFDLLALTHQRYVVDEASLHGLRWNTPRRLAEPVAPTPAGEQAAPCPEDGSAHGGGELLEQWLQQATGLLQARVEDQFESIGLARQLADRWPARYAQLRTQTLQLTGRAAELREQLNQLAVPDCSAAQLTLWQQRWQEVQQLRRDIDWLRAQFQQLPAEMAADRQALLRALQHDQLLLRETLHLTVLDGQGISEFLLDGEAQRAWRQLEPWLEFAQWLTDSPELNQLGSRGRDISFVDQRVQPNYLIRLAHLDGQLAVAGRDVHFVGRAENLRLPGCFGLSRGAPPTRLRLVTRGGLQAQLDAQLDWFEGAPRHRIVLRCENLPLPARSWGNEQSIQVRVAPGSALLQAQLDCDDTGLRGRLRWTQRHLDLAITPRADAVSEQLLTPLADSIGRIDQLDLLVDIARSDDAFHWSVHSDLGPQLSALWQQAAGEIVSRHAAQLAAQAEQQLAAQWTRWQGLVGQEQADLHQQLDVATQLLAGLSEPVAARLQPLGELLRRF